MTIEIIAFTVLVIVSVAMLEGVRAARHPLLTPPKAEPESLPPDPGE